jgi:hypothetical protein
VALILHAAACSGELLPWVEAATEEKERGCGRFFEASLQCSAERR